MRNRAIARRALLAAAGAAVAVALGVSFVATRQGHATPPAPSLPWRAQFPPGHGLITNEVAFEQPHLPHVRTSADWIVTSGSLFADDGTGFTGPVDAIAPDVDSQRSTNSAVFRAVTVRDDLMDVRLGVDLDVAGLTVLPQTGKHAWDGVHLFLRYTSPSNLYTVDLCRRDGAVTIKKKVPQQGGGENGTYTTLAHASFPCPLRHWQSFTADIHNSGDGVHISLSTPHGQVISTVDAGAGGTPPLRQAGRVGVRGDNAAFHFRNFVVSASAHSG